MIGLLYRDIATLMLGTSQIALVFKGTIQIWANEAVVVLGAITTATLLSTYFSPEQWTNATLKKRVVLPAELSIGTQTGPYVLATTETPEGTFAGPLTIEVHGIITGAGGAPNSGAGGHAIYVPYLGLNGEKVTVINNGTLRSGAGGGGRGGDGGAGYWYDYRREPASGYYYSQFGFDWDHNGTSLRLRWGANTGYIQLYETYGITQINAGGYTWFRGALRDGNWDFEVARQLIDPVLTTTYGGAGGLGGRGRGFNVTVGSGLAGEAGGTNAGAGGKGGNGGAYGANGVAGTAGTAGNYSGGLAGAAGGLAGAYLFGAANTHFTNNGTVQGRLL